MDIVVDESDLIDHQETTNEKQARIEEETAEDQFDPKFVSDLIDKLLFLTEELTGITLHPYQTPFARRLLESLIINDGATLTGLWSRQSGKTETNADILVTAMVMLPHLAKIYPQLLDKFKNGVYVGTFAPTDGQSDIIFGRMITRLSSERLTNFLKDETHDKVVKVPGKVPTYTLKRSGSLVSKQTAHPKAKIEGRTYHIILVDECQDAEDVVVNKSIAPMGASTHATMIYIGTPSTKKGVFYKQIQINKRKSVQRGKRQNHFQADWKEVAKWNKNYEMFVKKEMLRIGEDSDEFKLSYRLIWLLDKGMFTSSEVLDYLGDPAMETVTSWTKTPVVVGIDPARKLDSTIVTVVWVDWDHPDEQGLFSHRILNWLDLEGVKWEEQYARIVDFLDNYLIFKVGIDEGGMGDLFLDRLQNLMPNIDIIGVGSDRPKQSDRWKNLLQLLEKKNNQGIPLLSFPMSSRAKRLRTYKRFRTQMEDLELKYEGPYLLAAAPRESGAHDDYCDSLAIACSLSTEFASPIGETADNPFYSRRSRSRR